MDICVYIYMYIHMSINTFVYTCLCVYVCLSIQTHIPGLYACSSRGLVSLAPAFPQPAQSAVQAVARAGGDFLSVYALASTVLRSQNPEGAKADPKGPSTNRMRTLDFYIGNYENGLGQVLII